MTFGNSRLARGWRKVLRDRQIVVASVAFALIPTVLVHPSIRPASCAQIGRRFFVSAAPLDNRMLVSHWQPHHFHMRLADTAFAAVIDVTVVQRRRVDTSHIARAHHVQLMVDGDGTNVTSVARCHLGRGAVAIVLSSARFLACCKLYLCLVRQISVCGAGATVLLCKR